MLEPYRPIIVAHRGLHGGFPENSLAAFDEAGRLGLEWVECDVWPCADGSAVVIHDETLDRTTTGKGLVRRYRPDELRQLRLRRADASVDESSWLPTLEELANSRARRLLVEIKPPDSPAFVRQVIGTLSGCREPDRWMIQSFDQANLVHAMAAAPGIPLALLVEDRQALARGIVSGWNNIHVRHELLDAATAAELRAKGIGTGVWTPTRPQDLRRALDLRAQTIITDDPAMAESLLNSMRASE